MYKEVPGKSREQLKFFLLSFQNLSENIWLQLLSQRQVFGDTRVFILHSDDQI